jgi:hypothetical protein
MQLKNSFYPLVHLKTTKEDLLYLAALKTALLIRDSEEIHSFKDYSNVRQAMAKANP